MPKPEEVDALYAADADRLHEAFVTVQNVE
jgi:hypothetical protein